MQLNSRFWRSRLIIVAISTVLLVAVAVISLSSGVSKVDAFPGVNIDCASPFCHFYPAATLRVTTNPTVETVAPGTSFPISISWSGGSGVTAIEWPDVLDNALFNPTPRLPFAAISSSGNTSSTLIAPLTPGVYTVRVYASKDSPLETYYQNVSVTVSGLSGPSITTTSLPGVTVGGAYSQSLFATGGTPP